MTRYVVLRQSPAGLWEEVVRVDARADRHAIQVGTENLDADGQSGTFVAVPERSFKARSRKVEMVEKALWS